MKVESYLDFDVFKLETKCSDPNSFHEDFDFTDYNLYGQKSFALVDSSDTHQPSINLGRTEVTNVSDKFSIPVDRAAEMPKWTKILNVSILFCNYYQDNLFFIDSI